MLKPGDRISILALTQARIVLIGGEPMDGHGISGGTSYPHPRNASAPRKRIGRRPAFRGAWRRDRSHSVAAVTPRPGSSGGRPDLSAIWTWQVGAAMGDVEGRVTATLRGVIEAPWLGMGVAIACIASALLLFAFTSGAAGAARGCASGPQKMQRKVDSEAQTLLIELRHRLWEPPKLFDDHLNGAPIMGAQGAFESDIRRAAESILREAGGERSKAREILRQRLQSVPDRATGKACDVSDVAAIWRQYGALSLVDGSHDAMNAYMRAVDHAPENPEAHMQLGVLQLRNGVSKRPSSRSIVRSPCVRSPRRPSCAFAAASCWRCACRAARCSRRARTYREALAEIEALQAAAEDDAACVLARDRSVTLDRIGDVLSIKATMPGRSRATPAAWRSPRSWRTGPAAQPRPLSRPLGQPRAHRRPARQARGSRWCPAPLSRKPRSHEGAGEAAAR